MTSLEKWSLLCTNQCNMGAILITFWNAGPDISRSWATEGPLRMLRERWLREVIDGEGCHVEADERVTMNQRPRRRSEVNMKKAVASETRRCRSEMKCSLLD